MGTFKYSGGVEIMGFISPTDPSDQYPVIDPLYGIDGFRNVNTLSDLNNIPGLRRRAGMVVGVDGGSTYYKLNSSPWNYDISDWSIFNSGGGTASGEYLPLSGGTVTGSTIFTLDLRSNSFSASTYQNLPIDIRVTGGTYTNGTATFRNNTGGTFNVTGFYTSSNDTFVTGATFSSTTLTLTRNQSQSNITATIPTLSLSGVMSSMTFNIATSGSFSASTYLGLPTDVRVTGGTYSSGTTTFRNNTGGTFTVTGYYTGGTDNDKFVTGFTYNNNKFTISDNSGGTFNALINTVTGLTVNGVLSATTISGGTFYGNGLELTSINNVVTVGLGGVNCDYSSIKSAVDSITGATLYNKYVVKVGPGLFVEDTISLVGKPYISIVGSDIQSTIVCPISPSQVIFDLGTDNEVSFLTISGATNGVGIQCDDIDGFSLVHKLSMYDNNTHILVNSTTSDTIFYGEYIDLNGSYTYGTKVISNNGFTSLANMENYYNFPSGTGVTYCNYATGSGATMSVFVGDNQSNGVSGSTAFYIRDGAELNASTITADGFTYGILNPNIGLPIRFDIDNASFVNGEWDLYVERNGTFGTFGGSSSHQKVYTISPDVSWLFLDIEDGELEITRKGSVTFTDGTHTDFTTLLFEGSTMGLMQGGEITTVSGFTINTNVGYGYLAKTLTPEVIMRIDWTNSQITLGANENKYIYINENSILSSSGTRPSTINNIVLGRVITNSTGVSFIDLTPVHSDHTSNRYGSLLRNAMGPIYSDGSIVTENVTPFKLDVTSGEYYYSSNEFVPSGGTGITFTQYIRNGSSGWVTSATTYVAVGYDDNSGTLSPLPLSAYTKHTLYVVGDGSYEKYFLVLGQNYYNTLVEAEGALLPTPPTFFTDSVAQIANIYIRQGTTGITQVEDIRPVIGFKAGGVNASSVHGNLLGLSADDHTQYLLVSGGRAMSGDLSLGGNDIVSAATVNGVVIETHATRHQFGGSDPIGSTTPGPNYIPYADVSSTLDSWVSTGTTTTLGRVKLSTSPVSASSPIVVGDNDIRIKNAITGITFTNNTFTYINTTGGTYNLLVNNLTGLTINGGLTVTGTSNLNGSIISTNLSGSTDRLVQVSSGGTFSASQDIIQTYINSLGAVATLLSTTSNWDINGVYTGTTITGTYQGQKHYDSNYFFEAVDDNLWIRLIRG